MNFGTAVKTVLQKYAVFNGRARRSEYWWFFLFNLIVSTIAGVIDGATGSRVVGSIVFLVLLLPGIAVGARRLHDTGRSGWWLLIAFIPLVGVIVLIVFFCQDSEGDNKYGPSPKRLTAGPTY